MATTTSITIKFKGKDAGVQAIISKVNRGLKQLSRNNKNISVSQGQVSKTGMDFNRTLGRMEKGLNRITSLGMNAANSFRLMSQGMMSVGKSMTLFITPVILLFFKKAWDAAVSFDAQLVRVQKTTGFTAEAMAILSRGIRDMALITSTGATELASIAEQLGQVGIKSVPEILKLTEILNMLILSTKVTADSVGVSMGRLANAFGIDLNTEDGVEELRRLINVINRLENDMATSVPEIIKGLENFAQAGAILDFPPQLGAAFVATLSALGFSADESGTAMRNLTLKTTQNLDAMAALMGATDKYNTVAKLTAELNDNFAATLVDIITAASASEDKVSALAAIFTALGIRGGKALSSLAANHDQLLKAITLAESEYETATSLQLEYERALLSTENQMKLLKNQFNELALVIGDTFLPIINTLIATAIPAVRRLIEAFAALPDSMKKSIIVGALFLALLGPLILFTSQMAFGLGMMAISFFRLIQVVTGVGFAFARLGLFFGQVALGVTGLSASTVLAVLVIGGAIAAILIKVTGLGNKIADFFIGLGERADEWGANLVIQFGTGMLSAAATFIGKVLTAIGNLIGRFLAGSSPPELGPLSHIDKWGKNVFDAFLTGFVKADFGILTSVGRRIEKIFNTLAKVKIISEDNQFIFAMRARKDLANLIKIFKETGQVSQNVLNALTSNLGEAADEVQNLIRLWFRYTDIQKQLAEIEKRRHKTLDTFRQEIQLIAQSTKTAEEKADAIRQTMRLRDEELRIIAKEEHALEDQQDIAKEQLDIQKALIDAMQKQDDIQLQLLATLDKLVGKLGDLGSFEFPELETFGIPDLDPEDKIEQILEDFATMGERIEAGKLAMEGFFAGIRGEKFDETIFKKLQDFDKEAGTDFANTFETLHTAGLGIFNIWEDVSGVWEKANDFFEELGETDIGELNDSLDNIAESLGTIAQFVLPLLAFFGTLKLLGSIPAGVGIIGFLLKLIGSGPGLTAIKGIIETIGIRFLLIASGITVTTLAIPLLVAAIVAGLIWIALNFDKVKAGWEGLKTTIAAGVAIRKFVWSKIKEVALAAWENIKEGWEGVKLAVAAGVAIRKIVWGKIKKGAMKTWESIKKGWTKVKDFIGKKIDEQIPFFTEIGEQASESWDVVKEVVGEAMDSISEIIQETVLFQLLDTLWTSIKENALMIWETFVEEFGPIWDDLVVIVETVWERIRVAIEKAWEEITDTVSVAWESFKTWISGEWETFKEWAATTWEDIMDTVGIAWEKITDTVSVAWESFKTWISGEWETFKEWVTTTWEDIVAVIGMVWDGLVAVLTIAWDAVKLWFEGVWKTFTTWVTTTWEGIRDAIILAITPLLTKMVVFWFKIKTAIKKEWEKIKTMVKTAVENVVDVILDAKQDFIDAGKAMIQGVIDGMGSMLADLIKKAAGLARAALNAIKGLLDMDSPSKVMMEIGVNMIQGMVLGIDKMGKDLSDMLSGTIGDSFSGLQMASVGGLGGAAPAFESGREASGNITLKFGKDSVRSDQDIEEIADSVERLLSQRAAGNMDVAAGFGEDF